MQQLFDLWSSLDMRRRIIVALATLAMFAAVLTLGRMAAAPSMGLLYSGLENASAGEVVRALEQRGVAYEIRGDSIFVEADRRDELRMTLASEGLPSTTGRGYELLDSLSGFGTTSQMFDAAYWRAKEGELARTIVGSGHISGARVHIANTTANPFQRNVELSASVSLTLASAPLTSRQVNAIKHLVSSAVSGLAPGDVAVIDGNGGLLDASDEAAMGSTADSRSEALRDKVQRLLEARVGHGNAVVEVTVESVLETELIRERRFDPESRVAISTEIEERATNSSGTGGAVTVASNLPDGEASGGEGSRSNDSETRERINYEVSETEREVTREPGAIRRLTVAVLVNDIAAPDADGNATRVSRPDDELAAMRELVASAVGYDEARGDVITIKSMQFEAGPVIEGVAATSGMGGLGLDLSSLIRAGVLALVALALGLFVVRPLMLKKPPAPTALPLPGGSEMLTAPSIQSQTEDADLTPLTGMIDDGSGEFPDASMAQGTQLMPQPTRPELSEEGVEVDPVERLRNLIEARREETVEILRNWMDTQEEKV